MGGAGHLFSSLMIFSWDNLLVLGNLLTPKKKAGLVVPEGHPGFGGQWPEYIAAQQGDSRSACPGLNALANHGEFLESHGEHFLIIFLRRHISSRWPPDPVRRAHSPASEGLQFLQ